MKKQLSIAILGLLLSNAASAILINGNEHEYESMFNYQPVRWSLSTTFSLPTVLIDDVAHIDLAADEVIAALVAGEEEAVAVYAQAFQTSEEEIMNAVENMEEISLEALQAEL